MKNVPPSIGSQCYGIFLRYIVYTFCFIRTLRFELHCWFLSFDWFEHQNVLIFSHIEACMFLIIYGFACSYCIHRFTTFIENVRISINCSQYFYFTTIMFTIYSVVYKKSIHFLWILDIRVWIKLTFLFFYPYTLMFLLFVGFQV